MNERLLPFAYNAQVLAIGDADTIDVRVDFGRRRYEEPVPVRVLGMAAREVPHPGKEGDPGGIEARDALRELLPVGTWVALYSAKDDKWGGRWLAHVHFRDATGTVVKVADVLIAQGWAVAWNGKGVQPKPPWPRLPVSGTWPVPS